MAQPIHCDADGHKDAEADVLVSQLANGETTAWCFTHYVEVCQAVVQTATEAQAEADQAAGEANARLEAASAAREARSTADGDPSAAGFPADPSEPDGGEDREEGTEPQPASLGGPEAGEDQETGPEPTPT